MDCKHYILVCITVYQAVAGQTDSTPNITADGSTITNQTNWVAVSRDLLKCYPFGSKIIIQSKEVSGVYTVHDVMNKRYINSIDILIHDNKIYKTYGLINQFKQDRCNQ
jgi:3D (Asp-Asp-Asp) domain-containing protein